MPRVTPGEVDRERLRAVGARLRDRRIAAGVSVRTLAERVGRSPSFISQLETGQVSPSIGSLQRVARELDLPIAALLDDGGPGDGVTVAAGRPALASEWSKAVLEPLTAGGTAMDAMLVRLGPGGRSSDQLDSHDHEQFAFVVMGYVALFHPEGVQRLGPREATTVAAGLAHRWENRGLDPAELLLVSCGGPR